MRKPKFDPNADRVRTDAEGGLYVVSDRKDSGDAYLQRLVKGNLYDREQVTLNFSSFNPGEDIDAAERWALTILRFVTLARLVKAGTLYPKPKPERTS